MIPFLIIALGLLPISSHASTKSYVSAGIGMNRFNFIAKDKDYNVEAEMQNKNALIPTLGFHTVPRPFWSSIPWLGAEFGFSFSQFSANQQLIRRFRNDDGTKPEDGANLGTEVKGYVGYLAPALVFMNNFSERSFIYGGFGFGVGYASVRGNYYQTKSGASDSCLDSTLADDIKANCTKESARYSGFALAPVVMGGLSLGWFGIRVETGGPAVKVNDKSFTTMNSTFSMQIQYFLN